MKTGTKTLASAMRILSAEITNGDGIAISAIEEAARRLEEQHSMILRLVSIMERSDADFSLPKEEWVSGDEWFSAIREAKEITHER